MGFWIMLFSAIIGIYLIYLGYSRKKQNTLHKPYLLLGIVLVIFAVYLGLPK